MATSSQTDPNPNPKSESTVEKKYIPSTQTQLGKLVLLVSGLIGRNEYGRIAVRPAPPQFVVTTTPMAPVITQTNQKADDDHKNDLVINKNSDVDLVSTVSELYQINPIFGSAILISHRDVQTRCHCNVSTNIVKFLGLMTEPVRLKFAELVAGHVLAAFTNAADRQLYAKHSEVLARSIPENAEWFEYMVMQPDGKYCFKLPTSTTEAKQSHSWSNGLAEGLRFGGGWMH